MSPWRNRLARLTVNQEVGSSNLPGDDLFFLSFSFVFCPSFPKKKKKTLGSTPLIGVSKYVCM